MGVLGSCPVVEGTEAGSVNGIDVPLNSFGPCPGKGFAVGNSSPSVDVREGGNVACSPCGVGGNAMVVGSAWEKPAVFVAWYRRWRSCSPTHCPHPC